MKKGYVLITGATSGIGYELMLLFAKDKHNLFLVSRNKEKLSLIKKDVEKKFSVDVEYLPIDLSLPESSKKVYEFAKRKNLNINILINNSGFGLGGEFVKLDIEKEEEMINLNILALTKLTYYFLQDMKKKNKGKILNVASLAGFLPIPYMNVYSATKSYVLSFSEALSFELQKTNITVSALCPGATRTNFAKVAMMDEGNFNKFSMSAKKVALIGYNGLMKGKRVIIPGSSNKLGASAVRITPHSLLGKILKNFNNN